MLVCLLGAGASVEAGPPTSMQMAHTFFTWAFSGHSVPSPTTAVLPNKVPTSLDDLFLAIWNYLCIRLGRRPNIEEIAMACLAIHPDSRGLTSITSLTRISDIFEHVDPKHVEIIEGDMLREMLKVWLKVNDDCIEYLYPLINLESIYPSETLKIFSLNYDLSIETACRRLGVPCSDGFTDGTISLNSVPVFTDVGQDIFAEAPVAVHLWEGDKELEKPRVELFKIHGSTNWFEHIPGITKKENAYEIYHDVRSITRGGLSSAHSCAGPLAKRNSASGSVFFWDDTFGQQSFFFPRVVFGTTLKFLPAVPFVRMYELFYRYLRRTSVCIVIGYSFQDEHVNAMLRDAFNRQTNEYTAPLNLILVDLTERQFLPKNIGLSDANRIWQVVGTTSEVLKHHYFFDLVSDLVGKGRSKLPRTICV